jgi:mannose-6-phosphate isomerase-like protein (cupin superfamily)
LVQSRFFRLTEGDALVVRAGDWHNILSTGPDPLQLYTVYAPPQHAPGEVEFRSAQPRGIAMFRRPAAPPQSDLSTGATQSCKRVTIPTGKRWSQRWHRSCAGHSRRQCASKSSCEHTPRLAQERLGSLLYPH